MDVARWGSIAAGTGAFVRLGHCGSDVILMEDGFRTSGGGAGKL